MILQQINKFKLITIHLFKCNSWKKNLCEIHKLLNVELPNTNSVSLNVAPRRSVFSRPNDTLDITWGESPLPYSFNVPKNL